MNLLLTRAAEDAKRTSERLKALGHNVMAAPVIDIVATPAVWPGGLVDCIMATSAHAFDAFAMSRGPTREARRLMPLLLVGGRTEEAARKKGFLGDAIVALSATDLAVEIDMMRRLPKRIVYLAGRDRKPIAEAALFARGQVVDVIETYEARVVETMDSRAAAALRAGHIDGVIHFSRRSAALFLSLMTKEGLRASPLRHFCLSEDIASLLQEAGCDNAEIAEAPTEAALLSLMPREAADQA